MKVSKQQIDTTYLYNYANSYIQKNLINRKKNKKLTFKESLVFKYNVFLNFIFLKQLKKFVK